MSDTVMVDVLKAKRTLKDKTQYNNLYLYIRSAKSHEERLIDLNFTTLMDHLQVSDVFRFTGSGRLVPQDRDVAEARGRYVYRGRGRRHGYARGRGEHMAYHANEGFLCRSEELNINRTAQNVNSSG